jgi:hypothetical protein
VFRRRLVDFVERKLHQNGIAKVVPDQELAEVYVGFERGRRLEAAVKKLDEIKIDDCKPPEDLVDRVWRVLKEHPAMRWDAAIAKIIADSSSQSKAEQQ